MGISTANSMTSTANSMTWVDIKIMLIEEYILMDEMQNLEHELWNLMIKDSKIASYTTRFNDVSSLCLGFVTPKKQEDRAVHLGFGRKSRVGHCLTTKCEAHSLQSD